MTTLISGNAPILYPVEPLFGLLHCEGDNMLEIPIQYPIQGEWGASTSNVYEEPSDINSPQCIDLVYLSIVENKFYSIESELTSSQSNTILELICESSEQGYLPCIVIGMAPYGLVAIWVETYKKSHLISVFSAKETTVLMNLFRPSSPNITLKEICNRYLENHLDVKENISRNVFPSHKKFVEYMQQYAYRYLFLYSTGNDEKNSKKEQKPELEYIEEILFDGTYDKLHDGGLMNYHQAGKPKKLAVKWHIKKSEYTAYFWFEDEEIRATFNRFYGAHPETKTDFMIRIDSEKNKYELALYRYGLKEPQVISESAYQLLVFKNKFEYYRSGNYNQPKGAWIW